MDMLFSQQEKKCVENCAGRLENTLKIFFQTRFEIKSRQKQNISDTCKKVRHGQQQPFQRPFLFIYGERYSTS